MPSRAQGGQQGSVKDPRNDGRLKQNRDTGRTKSAPASASRAKPAGGGRSRKDEEPVSELHEMLLDQLRDAHSAERQAIQGMKKALRKVFDAQLRSGIEAHIEQSEQQRERVEQALELAGGKPGRKVCEAMRGLLEEAQHELEEHDKGPLLDLVIVASQQRVEHYEIAAYGTMVEYCRAAGEDEIADILAGILEEEKAQDQRLTELSRGALLPAAIDDEDEDDEEEDEEEDEGEEDEEEDEEEEVG